MNLRNIFKNGLVVLPLYFASSFLQIINEIDVPELQLLASNLKPEECVKLVSFDSDSSLSDAQIQKLAREQSCFRRLVKWICQLRTVTRNTYPIVNELLERVGRSDLIACLAEFSMRGSKSPKVIREVSSTDDTEDYEGLTTIAATFTTQMETDGQGNKTSNQTIDKISVTGSTTIRISLQTAGILLLSTILLTCCCTLFIRYKITIAFDKIRGKTKKGKFIPIVAADAEDVSRSYYVRKPRTKRKRAPSYELVHTATQNTAPVVVKEPEEPPPPTTSCYRCYKKKRKKSARRPRKPNL